MEYTVPPYMRGFATDWWLPAISRTRHRPQLAADPRRTDPR